jgi:putative transcriptional regulator
MKGFPAFLALVFGVVPVCTSADEAPAMGKLLVATEEVRGPAFAETVILLLHYDEAGALGLVINRPMEAKPEEVLPDLHGIGNYQGTLYWGGPVRMSAMRALIRSDFPPDDALPVFDDVYRVPLDDSLPVNASSSDSLRFFIGYAGWAPGHLDRELRFGSWHVIPATGDVVFTDDPTVIWMRLSPPQRFRAAVTH